MLVLLLYAAILTLSYNDIKATNLSVCPSPEIGKPCLLRCEPSGEYLTSFYRYPINGSGRAYCDADCCNVKDMEITRYIAYRNGSRSTNLLITTVQEIDEGQWVCYNNNDMSNVANLTLRDSSAVGPKPEGGSGACCRALHVIAPLFGITVFIIGGLIINYVKRKQCQRCKNKDAENQHSQEMISLN